MKKIKDLSQFRDAYILHHTDDDGKAAGAIVTCELMRNPYTVISYCKYNYSHKWEDLNFPSDGEYNEDTVFFIVDLSIDNVIFDVITKAVNAGSHVIHIDHHKSSIDFINNMNNEQRSIYDKVISFVKDGISGCLLTWIFSCMTDIERVNANNIDFDLSAGRTHVMLPRNREYTIPPVIRYIDDNDVWIHHYNETKYFNIGFQMELNKSPQNKDLWSKLLYDFKSVGKYIDEGEIIYRYQSIQNKSIISKNAFKYMMEFDGRSIECLCVNTPYGNSRIFGPEYENYPVVIKFGFDGEMWHYTLYSHEKFEDVDVSEIAKPYGGGGHKCAAGFVSNELIFDMNKITEVIIKPL